MGHPNLRDVIIADEPVVYRYTGPGWWPGVPARDLTQHDIDALDHEAWDVARALNIYEEVDHAGKETT